MSPVQTLASQVQFRRQAQTFLRWYGQEREAAYKLGAIATGWMERYSRGRNARVLAEALQLVTGLQITGRTILYYRDIYVLDRAWRESTGRGRVKSRNHFQTRHVGPGHLRVVSPAKINEELKLKLLDEIERRRLTVKQSVARARQVEVEANRQQRAIRVAPTHRVVHGDAVDVVQQLKPGSIYTMILDWQWETRGIWSEVEREHPVHRPEDPVAHLCKLLRVSRPLLAEQCIVWIFSKTTAFANEQIGLPWNIQKAAHDVGLRYCSEYIHVHSAAGYRSKATFLAVSHTPIHAFVPSGFDFSPATYTPSVSRPSRSSRRDTLAALGEEKHPYQKPVALFEELIGMSTPGGLVFDAYAGSGAAGIAAVRCGCPYIGAELQREYVHLSRRRIASALVDRGTSSTASA